MEVGNSPLSVVFDIAQVGRANLRAWSIRNYLLALRRKRMGIWQMH